MVLSINIMDKSGPRLVPWGTPLETVKEYEITLELPFYKEVSCTLPLRLHFIHGWTKSRIPKK